MLNLKKQLKEILEEHKPYRIPKYKEILRAFGYMESRSEFNNSPNTTEHESDEGHYIALHHGSTNWWHVTKDGEQTEGKGMDKLKEKLLELHKM